MILNTKRLNIRPFRSDDIEDTFEIYTDADVCRYLLEDEWNTEDKEEFEKKIKNNKLEENSSLNLAVVLDKKVIGNISVWYTGMKQTVEIGFVFNPKFSGKGYANESVEAVIKKIIC